MSPRRLRTLIGGVLVTAVVGVAVLPRSHHSGTSVRTTAPATARSAFDLAGTASMPGGSLAGSTSVAGSTGAAAATGRPGAGPGTGLGTGAGRGTGVAGTSTSVAPPPTTALPGGPPPTTVAATTTTVAQAPPAGPASGRLVVALLRRTGTSVGPGGGIATMAADGSDFHTLVSGDYFDPAWSPNGRFIVFESTDTYDIWSMPAAGGAVTELAVGDGGAISPDGTRMVYSASVAYSTATPELMVQPLSETASALVPDGAATSLGVAGVDPVWSPDGQSIVYNPGLGASADLAVVNADGTDPVDLLGPTAVRASAIDQPGFSADGSTISFIGTDGTARFIDADGQNLRDALPGVVDGAASAGAYSTAWSPDHQRLAVLTGGGKTIVTVDGSGDLLGVAHLPVQGSPFEGIAFDGSGQDVYYLGGAEETPLFTNLYSIGIDGTRSRQVTTDGSVFAAPTVLP